MWRTPIERRRLFTVEQFLAAGHTRSELRWAERTGRCVRVIRGVYADGRQPPSAFDVALATMIRDQTPAWGLVAAQLLDLDAVYDLTPTEPRRHRSSQLGGPPVTVDGVLCTSGLQTMLDLATILGDDRWEQANESALHKKLFRVDDQLALLGDLSERRMPGVARMRRVLALRPPNAPATESRLETIVVQIARGAEGVPEPTRQFVVENQYGEFVARVDLSWPDLGAFKELDGQGHKGQPVYDSSRESAIVAAKGWLCSRMTWREAYGNAKWAARRLSAVIDQARRRPIPTN